jgi:RNA-directed DNA polymerase
VHDPRHHRLGRRLATPHLPQGAPTSPALASLAAFGLDRRLSGLARTLGVTYSRYADDLTFSGERVPTALLGRAVGQIAREEGFRVGHDKTRVRTRAARQLVCGTVVNERLNVPRPEYDRLKAILHDAALHGPQAANRAGVPDFRSHLAGRIAWVASLHPERGRRLRERFAAIEW